MATGRKFVLCGRGRRPSDDQVALRTEVEARLSELTRAAAATAEALLVGQLADAFTLEELVLNQVRFEEDRTMATESLDYPRGDELWMWPMVTFTDWTPCRAKWIV